PPEGTGARRRKRTARAYWRLASSADSSSNALSALARTASRTLAFSSFILSRLLLKVSMSSCASEYSVPSVSTQWSTLTTPDSSISEYVQQAPKTYSQMELSGVLIVDHWVDTDGTE